MLLSLLLSLQMGGYKIAFGYYQFNEETGVTHSAVIHCQVQSSVAKHLSGMCKSLDLFPAQKKKDISNKYSKQRLGMQLSSRAFAQQEQDPGFTNATGEKKAGKK